MYVCVSKGSEQGLRAKGSTLDEVKSLDFENRRDGSLVKGTFAFAEDPGLVPSTYNHL